jgi:hypothetical protein
VNAKQPPGNGWLFWFDSSASPISLSITGRFSSPNMGYLAKRLQETMLFEQGKKIGALND